MNERFLFTYYIGHNSQSKVRGHCKESLSFVFSLVVLLEEDCKGILIVASVSTLEGLMGGVFVLIIR